MAQQPNVDITEAERPRSRPEPAPATVWRADKPGLPSGPVDLPDHGRFGTPGPDHGWAHHVLDHYELPDDDPRLYQVLLGLVQARAAAMGRAPVPADVDTALLLCGYGPDIPDWVVQRREMWLKAVAHDNRPGATAVASVDRDLLQEDSGRIAYALRHAEEGKDARSG